MTEDIALAREDTGKVTDLSGDQFTMTLAIGKGPRIVTERKSAGEMIKAHLIAQGGRLWDSSLDVRVGTLLGFEITAQLKKLSGALTYSLAAKGKADYAREDRFQLNEDTDAAGLVRRIEGLLRGIPKLLAESEGELEKAAADLPRIERQLAARAFAKGERLIAVKARLRDIEVALQPAHPALNSLMISAEVQAVDTTDIGRREGAEPGARFPKVEVRRHDPAKNSPKTQTTAANQATDGASPDREESRAVIAARDQLAQKSGRGRGR